MARGWVACTAAAAALIAGMLFGALTAFAEPTEAPAQVLTEGAYTAFIVQDDGSAADDVLDASEASEEPGAQMQISPYNGSRAQRLYVRSMANGTFTIQPINSGLYLTDSKGKVIQLSRMASTTQLWKASTDDAGTVLTNVGTGRSMAVVDGAIVTLGEGDGDAHPFLMKPTDLLPDGCYELCDTASGLLLDVEGGSTFAGANVQLYEGNETPAQAWVVSEAGDGFYTLTNVESNMKLDVAGGSDRMDANVQQYSPNGTDAQLWKPKMHVDGTFAFENKGSGMVLAAYEVNGVVNVFQTVQRDYAACDWRLSEITGRALTGDAELDAYIQAIVDDNGGDLRACFDQLKNMRGVPEMDDQILWGLMDDETTRRYATYVMDRNESDCYGAAAVFTFVARACGVPAYMRAGCVPAISGAEAHGWTELYIDGDVYVCDVCFGRGLPEHDWYMLTYDTAHVEYIY